MTRRAFAFLLAIVAVATAALLSAPFGGASAAGPKPTPSPAPASGTGFRRGPHLMPLKTQGAPANAATPNASAPIDAHLVYNGGRIVSNIQVVEVLWGSGSFASEIKATSAPSMATYYQQLAGNPGAMNWLNSEYNTVNNSYNGTKTNQNIGIGSFVGQFTITPSVHSSTIDDTAIQSELQAQINAGHLPAPQSDAAGNNDTYYAIFFPYGDTITQGGSSSCVSGGFAAYHGTIVDSHSREYYYGVQPDFQAGSGCDTGTGTLSQFGNETSVASHELTETITDAEVGIAGNGNGPPLGWYDNTNGEIGDICSPQSLYVTGSDGQSYGYQLEFSNAQRACISQWQASTATANDFSISASPSSVTVANGAAGASTISTAVKSGTAETVSLAVSGAPSGVTTSLAPSSLTAGQSATLSIAVGAAVAPGGYTLTVTGTSPSTSHTTTVTLIVPGSTPAGGITNGDFETGNFAGWATTGAASVVSSGCHGGAFCAQLGAPTPTNGDSSASQSFTASSGSAQLSLWYKETCPDTVTYDWATVTLQDTTAGTSATLLDKTCTTNAWTHLLGTITGGHSYVLTLINHDDNYAGDPTFTLFDDVALTASGGGGGLGISNGGFEAGSFAGWTTAGTTAVVSSGCHGGVYCARLGSTVPTNGDSTATQVFTAPSGAASLVLWYKIACPDAVTYDWATVTLLDNSNGTTTTILPKTCTPGGAWTEATANLIAGNSYKLTLTSHDDNYTADPTYTLYDDVSIVTTGGTAPAITSASSATFTVGVAGSFTVKASGSPAPAISETGALPGGVSLSSGGLLSGIPAAGSAGSYPITITASNVVTPNAQQSFTLVVDQAPAFTSAASTTFLVGGNNSFTVTASGTPAPTLSESQSDVLPSGVTFNPQTGVLSGMPVSGGVYSYTLHLSASNGVSPDAQQTFTLTLNEPPAITSAGSATFVVGTAGSFAVTASGNPPPTFTETGALPGGVLLSASGLLSGTPAQGSDASYPIQIVAANGIGQNAVQNFVLNVNTAPAITANPANVSVAASGTASFSASASGTPAPTVVWQVSTDGGATFQPLNGANSTTLSFTAQPSQNGNEYRAVFSNAAGSATTTAATLTVTVPPAITSANSAAFSVGSAGSFQAVASGSPAPAFSESGTLPTGVGLSTAGLLSGTPATGSGGSYTFTLTASNGVAPDAQQTFTLTVSEAPSFTSANSATFTVGASGAFTIVSRGFPRPAIGETGALPAGLGFTDNHDGTASIAGVPAAGSGKSYTLTLTAANGVGAPPIQAFTLIVNEAPTITSAAAATFTAGTVGTFPLTATGFPVAGFSESGTLPGGLLFSSSGLISGTPAAGSGGLYPLTITASNGIQPDATQHFVLTVAAAPSITSATSATFSVGSAGPAFTVTSSGFPKPSLSVSNNLPRGLALQDNHDGTATLNGTPAAGTGGSYTLTFTASNAAGTANQTFTLIVQTVFSGSVSSLTLHPGDIVLLKGAAVSGRVSVPNGASLTVTNGSSLSGPIAVSSGGRLSVLGGSSVSAPLDATAPAAITLCASNFSAPVSINGATGPVVIGDADADVTPACQGNTFSAPLTVNGNLGSVEVGGNTFSAPVTVNNNSDAQPGASGPEIEGNHFAGGSLACSNNAPAPTNNGKPNVGVRGSGQCSGL